MPGRREPAHDALAEQSVIGALLHNATAFADLGGLKPEHFYRPVHEKLFNTIQQMYNDGEAIDAATVFAKLEKIKELQKIGGASYLGTLLEAPLALNNVGTYSKIIQDKWKIRKVNEFGIKCQGIDADPDDVDMALESVRQFLDNVDEERSHEAIDFPGLYEAWTAAQNDDRPSIETPWLAVNDKLTGGLQRQRLYVVGARPGCGKTVLAAQLGLYAALSHQRVLFFSLELSKEDLMGRILACGARVPYTEITAKRLTAESSGKISTWVAASAELRIEVDDTPDLNIEEITQRARIHKQRKGLDLVLIDYLQLMEESPSSGESRVQRVDHMAKRARAIARNLDCAVVVCAQLNRNIEDHGGRPRLPTKADFRESGGIEQTADAAFILSRPPDDNGEESKIPMMNLTVVKNRQGTEGTLKLIERFDFQRFDNVHAYSGME